MNTSIDRKGNAPRSVVLTIGILLLLVGVSVNAQQDPGYTQYMYNTMVVNSAYTGQRGVLSIAGLHRAQWIGIEGAPTTQSFSIHSPLKNRQIGLGFSLVNDGIGPANETYFDANVSYTVFLDLETRLSFGLKAGFHNLAVDWSKGIFDDPDIAFRENISRFAPTLGSGVYMHSEKWYVGLSVPDFLATDHYDDIEELVASERMNFYLIGGYVFDISYNTKLKPAAMIRAVSGAPLSVDISANMLFGEVFTLGASYRWDDSVGALAAFQISPNWMIGYSYDFSTNNLGKYGNGSHEIFLRFELSNRRISSPRFF